MLAVLSGVKKPTLAGIPTGGKQEATLNILPASFNDWRIKMSDSRIYEANLPDDKCKFCGSWSCGGYNCLNGLRNQLADAKTENERLRSAMSECVHLMKGSNCTEEELLSKALKKGLNS